MQKSVQKNRNVNSASGRGTDNVSVPLGWHGGQHDKNRVCPFVLVAPTSTVASFERIRFAFSEKKASSDKLSYSLILRVLDAA